MNNEINKSANVWLPESVRLVLSWPCVVDRALKIQSLISVRPVAHEAAGQVTRLPLFVARFASKKWHNNDNNNQKNPLRASAWRLKIWSASQDLHTGQQIKLIRSAKKKIKKKWRIDASCAMGLNHTNTTTAVLPLPSPDCSRWKINYDVRDEKKYIARVYLCKING